MPSSTQKSTFHGATYLEAHDFLDTKMERTICNNTRLVRRSIDSIALRLHSTDIITYKANGVLILNSGGWQTPTTLRRMRQFLPAGVSITPKKGEWLVEHDMTHGPVPESFHDGMEVRP